MPRTKQTKKPTQKPNNSRGNTKIDKYLRDVDKLENEMFAQLDAGEQRMNGAKDSVILEFRLGIPDRYLDKTLAELRNGDYSDVSKLTDLSSLKTVTSLTSSSASKAHRLRSLSCGDDEGYLTAGSGGRKSRSRAQKTVRKTSRSLSRSKALKEPQKTFVTPANKGKRPPATILTVTPKVNPSVPQVVLRRPKQGEMAISMQGSPLTVNSVITDTVPTVNIPLSGGRIMAIQPQRGLRPSQIPDFSPGTKRHIETLRDNLNKVCAMAFKS